jgi:hypothetical protein
MAVAVRSPPTRCGTVLTTWPVEDVLPRRRELVALAAAVMGVPAAPDQAIKERTNVVLGTLRRLSAFARGERDDGYDTAA